MRTLLLRYGFLVLLLIGSAYANAQTNDSLVIVQGKVLDRENPNTTYSIMVVNKRTGIGEFGDPSGTFSIKALVSDTIIIGAIGYNTVRAPARIFIEKEEPIVYLKKLEQNLKEVEVFAPRDLEEIHDDIQDLGFEDKDYRLSGIDALQSPITYLYQMFSKRERSKRKMVELENEVKRRDLLKELFEKYVAADIINLSDEAFDDFIDFCNFTDGMMKNTSQYDFIMLVKKKYEMYGMVGRHPKKGQY